jgi:hypothetical protein
MAFFYVAAEPRDPGEAFPLRQQERQLQYFRPGATKELCRNHLGNGPAPGSTIKITDFFIAKPTDKAAKINTALALGRHLILTPGIYKMIPR